MTAVLHLLFLLSLCQAFIVAPTDSRSSIALRVNELKPDSDPLTPEEPRVAVAEPPAEGPVKTVYQSLGFALLQLTSFGFTMVGFGSISGILLNLNGYGYQFRADGLHIDTLESLRLQAQFNAELYRSMQEAAAAASSIPVVVP